MFVRVPLSFKFSIVLSVPRSKQTVVQIFLNHEVGIALEDLVMRGKVTQSCGLLSDRKRDKIDWSRSQDLGVTVIY